MLSGVRVLVVEDEFLIMLELVALLEEAGAVVVGPCSSVKQALALLDHEDFSAAILDVRLGSESVSPVAHELSRRGLPFVFYTGQAHSDPLVAEWPNATVIGKPAAPRAIVTEIARIAR
jgi:DNA-binding NtrC family response regulator